MSKKLTILDIAKLAGVGKSTVSRVLTNDPKVKPATREKVEQVISDSGYVPSKSAQSMRGGSQKVIGVIISRLDSPSENRVVSAILDSLYKFGYDVVIMESQFDRYKTNEHLEVLQRRNVDGVIVFGFTGCDISQVERWENRAVVIAMDTLSVSSVNYDNRAVITGTLDHIAEQGIEDIAYLGVNPSDKTTGKIRLEAYQQWCAEHQIAPHFVTGELNHESAYALVDELMVHQPKAIACASDTLALGVVKRLQELGRHDILVTGVGANPMLSFLFPNTYSIDPGYQLAGETASKLLINQLSDTAGVEHICLEPLLD
ncbi:trehalose operon repressor TreR [Vibrio sp. SCSIO 43136]|uniref:trehalose operon repressor TreR n=1 Tax=Vibrio sp. SCSIO 43136 TaxID=2819101 RepID=UPI00207616CF|nr:trehalose operon repressor TreR [Vibrio sp. SCSIO 43136]USD64673.1 HTH-type transcriptional regulator TreR [Vibrio sp. SCSIO 43136]